MAPLMNIELPMMSVLAQMERVGIGFDAKLCQQQESPLKRRINELEQQAHLLAGGVDAFEAHMKDCPEILVNPQGQEF